MSRLTRPARHNVPRAARPLRDSVRGQPGVVANMFRRMARSPAVLQGFPANDPTLAKTLDLRTRARIALAVAGANGCDYCRSAHTCLGLNLARLSSAEVAPARAGAAGEAKANAAVRFVGVAAVAAENIFTNPLNLVAQTGIDFPVVRAASAP